MDRDKNRRDELDQSSATDERIAANQRPAHVAPATRDPEQTQPDGMPPGTADQRRSPLDPVM